MNDYIPAAKVSQPAHKQPEKVSQPERKAPVVSEPVRAPVREYVEVKESGIDAFSAAQFGESVNFYSRISKKLNRIIVNITL